MKSEIKHDKIWTIVNILNTANFRRGARKLHTKLQSSSSSKQRKWHINPQAIRINLEPVRLSSFILIEEPVALRDKLSYAGIMQVCSYAQFASANWSYISLVGLPVHCLWKRFCLMFVNQFLMSYLHLLNHLWRVILMFEMKTKNIFIRSQGGVINKWIYACSKKTIVSF